MRQRLLHGEIALLPMPLWPTVWLGLLQGSDPNAFARWADAQWTTVMIESMRALATAFWFLEKAAAGITRFLIQTNLWDELLNGMLAALRTEMPGILQQLMFAGGGGGLLYLALMLAGLLMILPNLGGVRLVDAAQVVIWGAVVMVLFVSASTGYDLIALIEQARAGAVQTIIQQTSDGGDLDDLVARPMMASTQDLEEYAFTLPTAFEQAYFPEPSQYEELTVFQFGGILTWSWTIQVETEASQEQRRERAQTGLAIAGLTMVPGWVLLAFGLVLATLTAAALILIVFFVVSLPLGFFDFGTAILRGIVQQYAYLFAITLLAVLLAGLLAITSETTWPTGGAPGPAEMMTFVPMLLIVAAMMSYVGIMATSGLKNTFGMVQGSIQTAMAPLAVGRMPATGVPGTELATGAAGLMGATALAAMTGGSSAALMAAGGALLSHTSSGAGHAAARLATAATGDAHHVFATTARGHGTTGVAAAALRQRRIQGAAGQAAYSRAQQGESARPADAWGAIDAGAYHTTDTRHLDAAEAAYDEGRTVEARHHLERAFGNREVAEKVVGLYAREGEAGQQRVRGIVRGAQRTAGALAREGQALFDHDGRATPTFQRQLLGNLGERRLLRRQDADDMALVGQIAGATVRQPVGIWAVPEAARQLARETLHPGTTSEVQAGDVAALHQLNQLATRHHLGEPQLEALFESTRLGRAAAQASGQPPLIETLALLQRQGEWEGLPVPVQKEAARLALLVTEDAQAQRGVVLETEVLPVAAVETPPQTAVETPVPPEGGDEPPSVLTPAVLETPVRPSAEATHAAAMAAAQRPVPPAETPEVDEASPPDPSSPRSS